MLTQVGICAGGIGVLLIGAALCTVLIVDGIGWLVRYRNRNRRRWR